MRKWRGFLIAAIVGLMSASPISAAPLAGEYTVNVNTMQLDADSWSFTYNVSNNNQQVPGTRTGLDGFYVAVPDSATISNVISPAPYWGGGYWGNALETGSPVATPEATLPANYSWLRWWGYDPASVYPAGSTATFGFQADNVKVGTNTGALVSYWGWYTPPTNNYVTYPAGRYSGYTTELIGPIPTPEPASMLLLGSGLVSLIGLRRKSDR
ncbi:MAG: PEP-CTERM sorting domain-containing protein [Candidatus Schekmanbacteria bacterium]|nr:PEP-CTERM sorting domain-containing protein [Candidatus Schekmanbacteria bacterium]